MAKNADPLNYLSSISTITLKGGYQGYLKTNAKNGYATISVNKCSNGIEIKIANVKALDLDVKKVLGVDGKDACGKPSIGKQYWSRALAICQDTDLAETLKIKVVNPTLAVKRLEVAIEALEK